MKPWIAMTAGVVFLACSGEEAPPADQSDAPDFETTQVADDVYRFRFNRHNALFVATPEGVVAFDPISTTAAAIYADEIKRLVPDAQLAAIVYSHRDADHATGAAVLREAFGVDAPIYGHVNSIEPLQEAANPDLPVPTVVVEDQMTIGEGETAIELHYLGRSHSDDMLVGFLPAKGIAFAVDFVSKDGLGYRDLASFHFPDMFTAIEGLQEIPYEQIVFGHGDSGDRATIDRQLKYYRDLDAAVRAAIAEGLSEDESAASVMLEDYRDWNRYEEFRELNVRGMYRKLTASD
ncbi:MAG: MBL fold metallo-hydrolase [Gemmatimonadetes bacterium]|nr:MBL fold metallo-hydrolase [Gemmatimonadota bacterium]